MEKEAVLFEGMTSIRAVIDGARNGVHTRRITEILYDGARKKAKEKELAYLRAVGREMGFPVTETAAEKIDALTSGTSHGGIIAYCTERTIPTLAEDSLPENGFAVMLEGIEDPFNFGYAMRTVYAAGADAVILSPRNWMQAAGTVCKSSAGASELLPLYIADGADAARIARVRGYKIVCAGIRDSVSAFDADLKKPLLLIVGGEKRGISRALLDEADTVVRLDYGRPFRGSLSAASAASVLAYEVLRQNRESDN